MLRLDLRYLGLDLTPPLTPEEARDRLKAHGMMGWVDLPEDTETLRAIRRYQRARPWAEDFVHVGIGGSALGPKALEPLGEGRVRLHWVDHVEPEPLRALLQSLNPQRTLVHVVSKSGSTAETLAGFLLLLDWLKAHLGEGWREHLVVTTDPEKGALRAWAGREGVLAFAIPREVGGRYSVLSPVGLLPLAFAGVDLEALLMGARKANETALAPLEANLPFQTALLHHQNPLPVHVFMVYSARLTGLPAWFVQLHDESLGKEGKGSTAVPALGPQDQHAQVQLFRDGPKDKLIALVIPEAPGEDLPIPKAEGLGEAGYLFGKTLFQLLRAEAEATYRALAEAGQRVYALYLSRVEAYTVGWLLQHLMWQTAYLGALMGVNPFDQPGVERGKALARALLDGSVEVDL